MRTRPQDSSLCCRPENERPSKARPPSPRANVNNYRRLQGSVNRPPCSTALKRAALCNESQVRAARSCRSTDHGRFRPLRYLDDREDEIDERSKRLARSGSDRPAPALHVFAKRSDGTKIQITAGRFCCATRPRMGHRRHPRWHHVDDLAPRTLQEAEAVA